MISLKIKITGSSNYIHDVVGTSAPVYAGHLPADEICKYLVVIFTGKPYSWPKTGCTGLQLGL